MAAVESTGFIVKATCAGHDTMRTMGLRSGYDELVVDLADAFDLIPASVTVFSMHNGTRLMVLLGSQGDLDVVLAEAMEWGSHVISIEISGIPARRTLDAVGCLASVAATVAQLFYLHWTVTAPEEATHATFYRELQLWSILSFTLLVNLGSFAYLLDDETDKNHPFRLWLRPLPRRLFMLVLAPFSGDVLPLVACKACGLDAPIRASTRDGVVKYGWFMMAVQDVLLLLVMWGAHTGETPGALAPVPLAAIGLTLFSLLLNLPRRVSHFVIGSCEAAYREKEELADDAKISFFAATKMSSSASVSPSKPRPEPPAKPAQPVAVNGAGSAPRRLDVAPTPSAGSNRTPPPSKQRPTPPAAGKGGQPAKGGKGGKSSKSMM